MAVFDASVPALKVTASETTGCGDSYCCGFIAGLIAGLAMGYDLKAACELGAAVSALVVTGFGIKCWSN